MGELSDFMKGMNRGQLIMIETMRTSINMGATLEQMTATLNTIEKQLIGDEDE